MASYFPPHVYTTQGVTTSTTYSVNGGGSAGYSTVTLNGAGTSNTVLTSNGSSYNWASAPYITTTAAGTTPSITVSGNAEFDGEIKWKGRDLGKLLETIEKRLAILTPNPKKLEKFEALRKAYDHYKLLEALCQEDEDDK